MKGKRSKSREAVLKGLYQWRLTGADAKTIASHLEQEEQFEKLDIPYFSTLLEGTIAASEKLKEMLGAYLDRPFSELSPVEAAILLMGTFELSHQSDIPYRVVINEAVELAKRYGGTDGHKYVNGVLDKLASSLRPSEFGKSS
jgi:N utilization substance protein B